MRNPIKAIADALQRPADLQRLRTKLSRAIGYGCPVCSGDLDRHAFAILGQQYVRNTGAEYEQSDFARSSLAQSWEKCQWQEVTRYCDSAAPAAMAAALSCSRTGKTKSFLFIVPFDDVEDWIVLESKLLEDADAQQVKHLIGPREWFRFRWF